MKREIKFRVWVDNGMLYPEETYGDVTNEYLLLQNGSLVYLREISNGQWCPSTLDAKPIHGGIIMQFTGLKDKNGKEIWEGDIVESKSLFGDATIRAEVIWNDKRAMWQVEEINPDWNEREYLHQVCESHYNTVVIGNRYENPSLIDKSTINK